MNDHLEDELRSALRHREPPAGFAERVLARTEGGVVRTVPPLPAHRWTWAAASLAACLTLGVGLVEYRQGQESKARGIEAKQELMQAMRITGSKLRMAQEKVRRLNE
jgi:hypothetical protein